MKKIHYVVAASALAIMVSGCQKSGSSPYNLSSTYGTTTTVTTASQGAQAASTTTNGFVGKKSDPNTVQGNYSNSIQNVLSNFGFAPKFNTTLLNNAPLSVGAAGATLKTLSARLNMMAPMMASALAATTVQETCSNSGGSMTVTGDNGFTNWDGYTYPVSESVSIKASNCDYSDGNNYNGSYVMDLTVNSSSNITLSIIGGDGNSTFDASKDFVVTNSSAGTTEIVSSKTSMSLTGSSSSVSMSLSQSGGDQVTSASSITTHMYDGLAVSLAMSQGSSQSVFHYDVTTNGSIESTTTDLSGNVQSGYDTGYSNFKYSLDDDLSTSIYTYTVNGSIAKKTLPNGGCGDGVYTVTTKTPVVYNSTTQQFSAGEIDINSNVVVTFSGSAPTTTVNGSVATSSDYCPLNY